MAKCRIGELEAQGPLEPAHTVADRHAGRHREEVLPNQSSISVIANAARLRRAKL
jgi:hypothetical protein